MSLDDLTTLRQRIEHVDAALVRLVAERTQLARDAGAWKRVAGQPGRDPAQEAVVLERAATRARELGLDPAEVRAMFEILLRLARAAQGADD